LYYKLNDNYPAVSWSSVDWYGAPKLGHAFFQQAFAPLHAAVIMDSVTNNSKAVNFPVYLFDDANALRGGKWQVIVRAFDSKLELVKRETFTSSGSILPPRRLGEFSLTQLQTESTPLLIVVEVRLGDLVVDRSFYVSNFERSRDCLFRLPQAQVTLDTRRGKAVVTNKGPVPAVGVVVQRLGHLDTFTASENAFWLDPGETKMIEVNSTDGLTLEAFNCPETKP
jgi:beta-mannosidase